MTANPDNAFRSTHRVPTAALSDALAAVEKLNRRFARLEIEPIRVTTGEPYLVVVEANRKGGIVVLEPGEALDLSDEKRFPRRVGGGELELPVTARWQPYECVDVELIGPELSLAGWSLLAVLDHAEIPGEVVIEAVPGAGEDAARDYRDAAPDCDHCGLARQRSKTYLVRQESDGEIRQIGSTCLQDFLGHNPAALVGAFDLARAAREIMGAWDEAEDWGGGGHVPRVYPLEELFRATWKITRAHGWVSKGRAYESMERLTPTADLVAEYLSPPRHGDSGRAQWERWAEEVEEKAGSVDEDAVSAALDWAARADQDDRDSDYLHNVAVIGRAGYCKAKTFGLAVSILPVHMKMVEREAVKARQAEEKGPEVSPEPGRRDIQGMIISTRIEEGYVGGTVTKMLLEVVEADGHYRLWGTLPSALAVSEYDEDGNLLRGPAEAGARVRLTATVQPKEVGFGFFSRPAKSEIVEAS